MAYLLLRLESGVRPSDNTSGDSPEDNRSIIGAVLMIIGAILGVVVLAFCADAIVNRSQIRK